MWIKVHYNWKTFTGLEFSNLTIFNQKYVKKFVENVKILKSPAQDSNSKVLSHSAKLLGDFLGKETIHEMTLNSTVYFGK